VLKKEILKNETPK